MGFDENIYEAPKANLQTDGDAVGEYAASSSRFRFHGHGGDYFATWIVNLLLSVLTLGIYSAWASVRANRYVMSNLEVAGSRFEYHGDPWSILKGRFLMASGVALYVLLSWAHPLLALLFVFLVMAASPWLVVLALRYRARNIGYRHLRFGFNGSVAKAYGYYIGVPILLFVAMIGVVLIFGLIMAGMGAMGLQVIAPLMSLIDFVLMGIMYVLVIPLVFYYRAAFKVNHIVLGDAKAALNDAFMPWLRKGVRIGLVVALIIVAEFGFIYWAKNSGLLQNMLDTGGGLYAPLAGPPFYSSPAMIIFVIIYILMWPTYWVGWQVSRALMAKVRWAHTQLGGFHFSSGVRVGFLIGLHLGNFFLFILTLGFAYPWLKMRTLRYNFENITVSGTTTFEEFFAQENTPIGAESAP